MLYILYTNLAIYKYLFWYQKKVSPEKISQKKLFRKISPIKLPPRKNPLGKNPLRVVGNPEVSEWAEAGWLCLPIVMLECNYLLRGYKKIPAKNCQWRPRTKNRSDYSMVLERLLNFFFSFSFNIVFRRVQMCALSFSLLFLHKMKVKVQTNGKIVIHQETS